MSDDIRIPKIYKPLFELIEGHHPTVTLVIITGGRYSGKSHTVNLGLGAAMGFNGHKILNARYTMTSAKKSIIPDFKKSLESLQLLEYYDIKETEILSTFDDSKMWFSGIKTGAKTQDSALKSLSDISLFYVEEASEIPTFEEWEKIDLSVRAKGVQAFSMMVLNPSHATHWIYQKFYLGKGVKAGFNGIKDGVMYIHSSWEDLDEDMIIPKHLPKFKADKLFYESNKLDDLTDQKDQKRWCRYRDVILGGWRDSVDNVIFEYWEEFDEWPQDKPMYHLLGLDFGFKDPNALVETKVYPDAIYTKQHLFKPDVPNKEIGEAIKKVYDDAGKQLYVICDNARPEIIKDLKLMGCAAIKCKKGPGSIEDGIQKINSKDLFVHKDSKDLHNELNNYHYVEILNNKGERKTAPVDAFNHLLDALRYSLSLY